MATIPCERYYGKDATEEKPDTIETPGLSDQISNFFKQKVIGKTILLWHVLLLVIILALGYYYYSTNYAV
jgi:hypothetical protein